MEGLLRSPLTTWQSNPASACTAHLGPCTLPEAALSRHARLCPMVESTAGQTKSSRLSKLVMSPLGLWQSHPACAHTASPWTLHIARTRLKPTSMAVSDDGKHCQATRFWHAGVPHAACLVCGDCIQLQLARSHLEPCISIHRFGQYAV